ncbi:MAG: hypothetical protein LBS96_08300 [Oscillospiraceae bacterium]|jgi:predicted thioesterase|nr:hypothetical protein [Oscillospiraceae bacterium]
MPELRPDLIGTATTLVTPANTAQTVGSGSLGVFATPMMIALMEQAACAALAGCLAPGQTSVGTAIAVAHTAASGLGMNITATAAVTAVNGRSIDFEVAARDDAGEIGRGTHTRVLVTEGKFMERAGQRR